MSFIEPDGRWRPGRIGSAVHHGPALTDEQISTLDDGTRIVVTWSGGNGPWEGTLVHDRYFGPSYQSDTGAEPAPLLRSLHRVTVAGSEQSGERMGETDG